MYIIMHGTWLCMVAGLSSEYSLLIWDIVPFGHDQISLKVFFFLHFFPLLVTIWSLSSTLSSCETNNQDSGDKEM